jgi:hypothetical protein
MASSNSDKELEQQLLEAGTKLLSPPSSLDDLLPLLDVSSIFFLYFFGGLLLTYVN